MAAGIPPNSLFSAFAFVGFLLTGLTLPWHIHSWHTGTCMYMFWTSFGCFIFFVDSIVWNDNVVNLAPVWCDISSHFLIGASVGIPASSLCIIRRLYYATKLRAISFEKEEKRREVIIDVSIGIGFPCIVMALYYVVQSHRFIIIEQIGCYIFITNTLAAYFLIFMWPPVIGLVSLVYAVLTFRWAFRQKEELRKMLHTGFFISAGCYWRLMALCIVDIISTIPLGIYVIVMDVFGGVGPYVSWAWLHSDFSDVQQYPTDTWQNSPVLAVSLEVSRWLYILCAFLIFMFFGWSQEARYFYRHAFSSVCRLKYLKGSNSSLPTPVGDVSQHWTRSRHLSTRTRVRRYSLPTSPSLGFEGPRRESLSSNSGLSVGGESTEGPPKLHSLSGLERYTKISWESLIAAPEPVLCRDRRSVHDVDQLV